MEVLQQIYILIFNPICKVTKRIPERVRNGIIGLCFTAIFAIQIFRNSRVFIWSEGNIDHTQQALMGCILMFVIVVLSLKSTLEIISCNKLLTYLWLICAGIILAVSFIHPVGNGIRALSVMMIIVFPCIAYVWENRGDYDKLFELAAKGIVYFGTVYLIYCLLFVDGSDTIQNGRYLGTTQNPNALGLICNTILIAALYLVYSNKHFILYSATAGLACMFTMLTVSRTTMLSNTIGVFVFIIFYLKDILSYRERIRPLIKLVVTLIIMCTFSFFVLVENQYYNLGNEDAVSWNMDNMLLTAESVEDSVTDTGEKYAIDRLAGNQATDLDSMSSRRTIIWKEYLKSMNLLGHDGNKLPYIEGYGSREWAHNTALEIGYRTGVVNGIIFFVIEIIAGLYALKFTFSRKCMKPYHLFSAMSIMGFCIYSVLEVVIFPFFAPPVFLFFIGIGPLFFKTDSRREQHQHAS